MADATPQGAVRPQPATAPTRWTFESSEDAPRQARVAIADFAARAAHELRERACLLVSEVVTNSVVHARGKIRVEAWLSGQELDVVVSDDGAGFVATPRVPGHDDAAGRGLVFVDMLSEGWSSGGVGAPWVWFHLQPRELAPSPPAKDFRSDPLRERLSVLMDGHMLLDSVKDYAIFGLDTSGRITSWNAGAERVTGYRTHEVIGRSLAKLLDDPDAAAVDADLSTALAQGRCERECWLIRRDGGKVWADEVISPVYDSNGELRGFADVTRDMTWRKRRDDDRDALLGRISALARTDELTGLPNRRRWHEELDRELARARRHGGSLCVALLDVDGFKEFNDTQGHQAGDRLLQAAARVWSRAVRTTDMLARYGGDEFAVVLPECELDEAVQVIERVTAATPSSSTASAGVTSSQPSDQAEQLIARADAALYAAKRGGRNAVACA